MGKKFHFLIVKIWNAYTAVPKVSLLLTHIFLSEAKQFYDNAQDIFEGS